MSTLKDLDAAPAIDATLSLQLESMGSKGFTVRTDCGDLVIPPGRLACRMADLVDHDARLSAMRQEYLNRVGLPS
jgi:hypothetical protein